MKRNVTAAQVIQPVRTIIQQRPITAPVRTIVQHVRQAPVKVVRQIITAPVQSQVIRRAPQQQVRQNRPQQRRNVIIQSQQSRRFRPTNNNNNNRPTVIRRQVVQQVPRRAQVQRPQVKIHYYSVSSVRIILFVFSMSRSCKE